MAVTGYNKVMNEVAVILRLQEKDFRIQKLYFTDEFNLSQVEDFKYVHVFHSDLYFENLN